MGRSMISLMDNNPPYNLSQVDHRTIKSLILKNVKYVLKGNKNEVPQ